MNMKRQLTLRFVQQLVVAGLVVLLIAAVTIVWMLLRFVDISIYNDFASVGLERLVDSSKLTKEGIRFDPKLLEQVKKNNGWLQSLDEEGQVENSYHTPNDVPQYYAPGEFVAYWRGENQSKYNIYLWIQEKDSRLFTLIYGVPNDIGLLLTKVQAGTSLSSKGQLILSKDISEKIAALNGHIQLLDSDGSELGNYNKPATFPTQYSVAELALRTQYSDRYGYNVATSYEEDSGRTWVVAVPTSRGGESSPYDRLIPAEARIVLIGLAAMLTAILIIFILLALWNAHRFGAPMLHMLTWLDSLGNAKFGEPVDRKGIARSRTQSGKWRQRYRIFADVMFSIDKLSNTLQRDQALRQQTDSLREEWIAGITHDLKTPLSSIKGFAHLLAENKYTWTENEVRTFSSTILEKSAHMDMLISDLAMTYRLKSGVHPPMMEVTEMNGWLRHALEKAGNNTSYRQGSINFCASDTTILAPIYAPWLERVINNLTANALLHNPPATNLTVSLIASEDDHKMTITFTDDGIGMDEATLSNLFERYYRGTDTVTTSDGSGLGMAVSKGLVEAMGGQIVVDTTIGKGTTIHLIWI